MATASIVTLRAKGGLSTATRVLLVALFAIALYLNREPQSAFNGAVRAAFGRPAYRGPWLLVEHALLSGSLMFAFSLTAWVLLARRGVLPAPREWLRLRDGRRALVLGVAGGALPLLANVAVVIALQSTGRPSEIALGYTAPLGWSILGNVVSNMYEE